MTDAKIILTTVAGRETATALANQLVELRLAACVNVGEGVHSIYRWQGAVESASEVLLVIKTGADRLSALKQTLAEIHPYELPEFLVLDVADASMAYLNWLIAASRQKSANCNRYSACCAFSFPAAKNHAESFVPE